MPVLLLTGLAGQPSSAAPTTEVLARVHWLGLTRVSADTNSAHFMSVWRLPQTTALLDQTLDNFSRWPAGGATNAASPLLRPLLDDLVSSESYWELRASSNSQPSTLNPQLSFALAVRLPADRARIWQTSLANALTDLTGIHPVSVPNGWLLRQSHAPEQVEFYRAGEWTFVGWGPDTTNLLPPFADRIARDNMPPSTTDVWLEADLDPLRLADIFSLSAAGGKVPSPAGAGEGARRAVEGSGDETKFDGRGEVGSLNISTLNPQLSTLNHLHLTATGEGGNVVTRGTLEFSRPLNLSLPPWEIPTNLILQPLISFSAVRGIAPWLAAMPAWQKLGLAPPPDQMYCWAEDGIPFQTYFAAPLPAASNQLWQLAGRLVQTANPWLATNGEGSFQWAINPPCLVWNDALLISPYLLPVTVNQHDYVLGGLYPRAGGNPSPMLVEILRAILNTTNLIYYQTEQTGFHVEDRFFITQLFRVVFHKAQLPAAAAATVWLKKAEPLLGASTTIMTQTGPAQLNFARQSTVGLNALELHLLADWLESPQFPHGLHTFLAPPDQ